MVNIYVRKIHSGEMTIDNVPERWREAVKKKLEE